MEAILVITNLPDQEAARRLAGRLVEERLAACVNILAPCESVYRWQGQIETGQEITLLIKTLSAHYGKVEKIIQQWHPYELPEIIAVPIAAGLPAYLEWLAAETVPLTPPL
ncbi:MAG: divalent-cation tolerance protein CutA [Hydrogenophilales bacterium CG_4_9_14_3_um_filter_59_35]|nr:MAG: divalent-cation tolerance protein CutA [Hydrogenophilales bacterium CG18_big_fil_WC_8_21_14_2_50_58_12]PIX99531.1 MAG: divalent-cation tolerance protein CutA [Hydrogenophilales bacterium CG_4_10_14_3_um_filter_58_23]PJB05429.1 MAG: divalent-cation tolerance protein CutA [Hydrogenophilales bacterium CG_4_9_14_3_um_filter_59_35]